MNDQKIPMEKLGEVVAYNDERMPVQFSWFWSGKTAVLVFVRHFG